MKNTLVVLMLCLGLSQFAWANDGESRASVRTRLASEYYKLGQYTVAVSEAQKALDSDPKYLLAYNVMALSYWALKDNAMTIKLFKDALSLEPTNSDLNHNYANFLCANGDVKQAQERFGIALSNPLYPTPDQTMLAAANCAISSNDLPLAIEWYKKVLSFRPNNIQAKFQLSSLLLKSGDLPEAKRYFIEMFRATKTPQSELLWLGVKIEHAIGNKTAEQRYAAELMALYPDSVEATKLQIGKYD
ncbi:type IV pilus biogenesis/stability protein PilW [Deefgea tanakiae]|uniref:Type IV pilus biogenesis/stability protein PilW n=1 Tax=Deefgea tanakiae TaxID=2865840 RepID=A0ABX8Z1H6_9NEIS|nr:type IV pilus biogenesis/stability protein PilW [Deefgea tanakiae]QZA76417.1 type IV pilus biogenesis/stability protein PilW [Deefgea tanakiae]